MPSAGRSKSWERSWRVRRAPSGSGSASTPATSSPRATTSGARRATGGRSVSAARPSASSACSRFISTTPRRRSTRGSTVTSTSGGATSGGYRSGGYCGTDGSDRSRRCSRPRRSPNPSPTGVTSPSSEPCAEALARALDADPPAERPHGARGAPGRDRRADVLAEGDEEVVVADPVSLRELGPERHLGLLGRPRPHVSEAVGDPVHVGVDADPRLAVAHRHDQVGGLPPDALQREERVDLVGHAPPEALEDVCVRYLSLMDSRSFRARGRSFTVQSATFVGAVSAITCWSSPRASA